MRLPLRGGAGNGRDPWGVELFEDGFVYDLCFLSMDFFLPKRKQIYLIKSF